MDRAYLAEFGGSAEHARAFASRALGEIAEEEWMLEANTRAYLALAERLCGRLEEAGDAVHTGGGGWLGRLRLHTNGPGRRQEVAARRRLNSSTSAPSWWCALRPLVLGSTQSRDRPSI